MNPSGPPRKRPGMRLSVEPPSRSQKIMPDTNSSMGPSRPSSQKKADMMSSSIDPSRPSQKRPDMMSSSIGPSRPSQKRPDLMSSSMGPSMPSEKRPDMMSSSVGPSRPSQKRPDLSLRMDHCKRDVNASVDSSRLLLHKTSDLSLDTTKSLKRRPHVNSGMSPSSPFDTTSDIDSAKPSLKRPHMSLSADPPRQQVSLSTDPPRQWWMKLDMNSDMEILRLPEGEMDSGANGRAHRRSMLGDPRIECRLFASPVGCPYGDACVFRHVPRTEDTGAALPWPSPPSSRPIPAMENESRPRSKKLCTRFFSTSGCEFGEDCYFQHYIYDGAAPLETTTLEKVGRISPSPSREMLANNNSTSHQSRVCKKFGTPQGCRFGDHCRYQHVQPLVSTLDDEVKCMVRKLKTELCYRFDTPRGCQFGRRCYFAHGVRELGTLREY